MATALAAVAELKDRNFSPERAAVIAVLTEEEGARFRVPCLGTRLMTGAVSAEAARALTDDGGITLARAMASAGGDPDRIGPDDDLLNRIAMFVELHVEQGRALEPLGVPVGVGGGHLAARPLAAGLHGPGRSRGHGPAAGPARPDAALRPDRAGRP